MKKARFTDEQKVSILQQAAAGTKVRELCRKHGISEQTFDRWRGKLTGVQVSDVKRLRGLEDENRRLKKLVADLSLDNAMLKDAVKNRRRVGSVSNAPTLFCSGAMTLARNAGVYLSNSSY